MDRWEIEHSTEQSRAAFEKFMEERFGDLVDHRRALNGDKGYMSWDMAIAWFAWRESRAALVVEFPDTCDIQCQECADDALERVEYAIRAVGITVKGE